MVGPDNSCIRVVAKETTTTGKYKKRFKYFATMPWRRSKRVQPQLGKAAPSLQRLSLPQTIHQIIPSLLIEKAGMRGKQRGYTESRKPRTRSKSWPNFLSLRHLRVLRATFFGCGAAIIRFWLRNDCMG